MDTGLLIMYIFVAIFIVAKIDDRKEQKRQ